MKTNVTSFPGVVLILLNLGFYIMRKILKQMTKCELSLYFTYPCFTICWNYNVVDGFSFKVVNADGQAITKDDYERRLKPSLVLCLFLGHL